MHYHNITKDDMLNGDGLRVVLWTAGCKHGCKGCHNPVTWDAEETGRLIRKVKQEFPDKTIWLYTGYTWEEINDLPYIGLIDVLVDGRFEEELADSSLKWKGSSNQRVIRVKKSMEAKRVILHQE